MVLFYDNQYIQLLGYFYYYHFLLDTPKIEKGYEERALSVVKLTFDKKTQELTRMAGRFAGLKISIKYRRYLSDDK